MGSDTTCKLALADGTVVTGQAIGAKGEAGGELCFNTSMTGYQEILTDPSYYGQIMMMTYPHIGNYGASDDDTEAARPQVAALVVRAFSRRYSNQRAEESLEAYMLRHGLVGITGVDTRSLVLRIRHQGVMNAIVSSEDLDEDSLVSKARAWPSMDGLELASRVSVTHAYDYAEGRGARIAVYDFGCKMNILRTFKDHDCHVRVFPQDAPLADVMAWGPDGFFFSNGPGDPAATGRYVVPMIREVLKREIPVFGICLGHQMLGLALGAHTMKMAHGHHGANHPVRELRSGRVSVVSMNHGFALDRDTLPARVEETHRSLFDGSNCGIRALDCPAFSVQFHPEASPGPQDSFGLFDRFAEWMDAVGGRA